MSEDRAGRVGHCQTELSHELSLRVTTRCLLQYCKC